MISKIAKQLVAALYSKSVIKDDEVELYTYGLFILLSHLMYFLISLAIGIAFQIIIESILFFVVFFMIRNYAGGIHASSEVLCFISTTFSIVICELLIRLLSVYYSIITIIILLCFALIIIVLLSPVDSANKPLTKIEKQINRKKTYCILISIVLAIITFHFLNKHNLICASVIGLLLASVLLLLGRIQGFLVKNRHKKDSIFYHPHN